MAFTFQTFAEGTLSGTNTTPVTTSAFNLVAGRLVVVGASWEGGGENDAATVTITDTAGNTYELIGSIATSTGGTAEDQKTFLYWCKDCLGNAANVVSATPSVARGAPKVVMAAQYSYTADDVELVDFEVAESGSNVASFNTAAMAALAGDLIACHVKWNTSSAVFAPDAGYTARASHSDAEYFDQIVSSGGNYTPGGDFTTGTDSHATVAAIFREVSGAAGVEGDLAATDAADTAAAAGDVLVTGDADATDAADTAAAAGDVLVSGDLAAQEGAGDAAAIAGDVLVEGDLAATDGADAAAIAGDVIVTGTMAATDGADILAASGRQDVTGDLEATDQADGFAATGTNATEGDLEAIDGIDAAAIAGEVPIAGDLGATDAADAAAISGSLETERTGDLAALETADGFTASGELELTYSTDFRRFKALLNAGEEMSRVQYLDSHERFAKRESAIAFVHVVYDNGETFRITKAEYDRLTLAQQEEIKNGGVSVRVIDEDDE